MFFRYSAKIILGIVCCLFFQAPAQANLRLCNNSQDFIGIALGYPTTSGWVSEGWWRLAPGRCENVLHGPLQSRFYYIHVEDDKSSGGAQGPVTMCLKDEKFKIVGVKNCLIRGYQRGKFEEIDTSLQKNWTVRIVDKNQDK